MNDRYNFEDLQKKLGYHFANTDYLHQAMTHSSYANEKGMDRHASNERLEFLGDAVLEMTISELLYHHTPMLAEGEMTKLRARLVCEKSLSEQATKLDLGSHLLLGHGEDSGGGRTRPSILADAFEALIAAIYLDGGMEPAVRFVERTFGPYIAKPVKSDIDYKTRLQEIIQNKTGLSLEYKLIDEQGPDHNKTFTAQVIVNKEPKGTGTGKNKKAAEQAAAKEAIISLKGGE